MDTPSTDLANEGDGLMVNALSFDIEDWFHIVGVDAVDDPRCWGELPSIVEEYTEWIVETVSESDVRATFFVLGWVAEQYPHLVDMIADAGHELGTHSFWHRRVYQLSPDELRKDLRRSIDVIQDQAGEPVRGFRAPSFSITRGCEWALDVVREVGLEYDASLFPASRGHGGYPCPKEPHIFKNLPSGGAIPELPMSVAQIGPLRVPFSGGGYIRLLPEWVICKAFDHFNSKGLPVVVYLHPRDFAPDCPRVDMPWYRQFKSYVGLASTKRKLRMLLDRYEFTTCESVVESYQMRRDE